MRTEGLKDAKLFLCSPRNMMSKRLWIRRHLVGVVLILGLFGLVGLLVAGVTASPDPSEIVAHWRFDEGTENIAHDWTANNNHGTIYGATWVYGGPHTIPSMEKALSFDGVDDYIEVPDSPSLDIDGSFTLEAWIKLAAGAKEQSIIDKRHPGVGETCNYGLYVSNQNTVRLHFYSDTWHDIGTTTALTVNTWYHVVAVFDADNDKFKIYLDGILDTEYSEPAANPVPNNEPVTIGHWSYSYTPDVWFDGIIDDVRIYNVANAPPRASRYSPTSDTITLTVGQSQTFVVLGEDPDGNLSGTEWYLDGVHQISHWTLYGSSGTDSWSYTFNEAGTFYVEALVFDTKLGYSSGHRALWTVSVRGPHDPIYINGNDNFTYANGVTSGSGTENDPYIIENWDISAENAHGIEIRNTTAHFVVRNCYVHDGGSNYYGIYFYNVRNGKIDNNLAENNGRGIYLRYVDNNLLSNNLVENNHIGIFFYNEYYDDYKNIMTNNLVENNYYGIYLDASNNTLRGNVLRNNAYEFRIGLGGNWARYYHQDIDNSNTIDGKPIYYLIGESNLVFDGSFEVGFLGLVESENIWVENLQTFGIMLYATSKSLVTNSTVTRAVYGILLYGSDSNLVSNNLVENNDQGIYLNISDNNLVENNTVKNSENGITLREWSYNNLISNNLVENNLYGIHLERSLNNTLTNNTYENNSYGIRIYWPSDNNRIHHNNFLNNATQAYDDRSNYWDAGYPSGGNYWSDYTGVDENHGENQDIPGSDGIGDTLYNIPGGGNQDRYPLMRPWSERVGLADTPWPKFKYDAQNTGRSPHPSISQPELKWTYTTSYFIRSSPVIASDGTIYIGSEDNTLYALNPDGTLKWSYTTEGQINAGAPAVASDGTVYVGSAGANKLYVLNPDGTLKWSYTFSSGSYDSLSPTIAPNGTVYVGSDNLYAINPDGTLKWSYDTDVIQVTPAIAPNGTIYVISADAKLYAINPDGTLKWTYTTSATDTYNLWSSPSIGSDNTIYVGTCGDNKLYAINPDGTLRWTFQANYWIRKSPSIALDGTIYVGEDNAVTYGGEELYKFYAINPDGTLKWSFTPYGDVGSSASIASDGTVYFASFGWIYALNPDGTLKWDIQIGGGVWESSPAINTDGTIYISSYDYKLYSIGEIGILIPAIIDIYPDTLNLRSKGKWITAYIELPLGYSVENIDVSTVRLIVDNDNVPAEPKPTGIGDHDNDGIPDLMVKFNRSAVQALSEIGEVEMTVIGEVAGMPFEGSDIIRVIDFGVDTLYQARLGASLNLDNGQGLAMRFYTYAGALQGENVIGNGALSAQAIFLGNVPHPEGRLIEDVALVLTDDADAEIETVASFTVTKTMLEIRFAENPSEWALASPAGRVALEMEFAQIPLYWALAPS